MRLKFVYAALAATPVTLLAFSTGPPIKRTGNIDGGTTCTACHATFAPANSDVRGSVKMTGFANYNPGATQTLKITISHPDAARWGFQLTARFVTNGAMAGTFVQSDDQTKIVCDDGSTRGAAGPCQPGQLSWIEHSNAVRTDTGAGYTYEVKWIPPSEENGDITFYFAGNAADGGGSPINDRIYNATQRISLSSTSTCSLSKPAINRVVNAAAHAGNIAPGAMIEIYGSNFQVPGHTRNVGNGDLGAGKFPSELGCIAVEIDGQRVPLTYVQQDQINAQAPGSNKTGPVAVAVIANPGRSNEIRSDSGSATFQAVAPAFFTFDGKSIAAQFAGKSDIVATSSVVPGANPAKPGDVVTLYGTGFGVTSPAAGAGSISNGLSALVAPATLTVGGIAVSSTDLSYIGLAPQNISGLYQLNVKLPAALADGDQAVVVTIAGVSSPATSTIPVKK